MNGVTGQIASTNHTAIETKYRRLLQWAQDNGTYIHPSLKYIETADRGVEAIIDPEGTAVKSNEPFLRVSYNLTLSYFNAISAGIPGSGYHPRSKSLPKEYLSKSVDHDTINAIFLVQQYLLGEASFWYPYIQILPQPNDEKNSAIPILWGEEDLKWLRGTHLEDMVPEQKADLRSRWREATAALEASGWDTSAYTLELGMWAHYIFLSRSFWSIAFEGDIDNIKPEYQVLAKCGVSLDDTAKILIPVLDSLNHEQIEPLEYDFVEGCLGLAKVTDMEPGHSVHIPYDKDTQRFNNTFLLKEFGFILPDNQASELTLRFPFDVTKPMHPSHSVFSTPATIDEPYAFAYETHLAFVTVRSPSHDRRGVMNPQHPVEALRHFHPTFVSMVSFHIATLVERAALRIEPFIVPSERNGLAVIEFLTEHMQKMLDDLMLGNRILEIPTNQRQRVAKAYRNGQEEILVEVLADMKRSRI